MLKKISEGRKQIGSLKSKKHKEMFPHGGLVSCSLPLGFSQKQPRVPMFSGSIGPLLAQDFHHISSVIYTSPMTCSTSPGYSGNAEGVCTHTNAPAHLCSPATFFFCWVRNDLQCLSCVQLGRCCFIERQHLLYVIQANFIYATDPLSSLHLVQGKAELVEKNVL